MKKSSSNKKPLIFGAALLVIVLTVLSFSFFPRIFSKNYNYDSSHLSAASQDFVVEEKKEPIRPPQLNYIKTPDSVKAVYMTACVAGTPSFREQVVDLIEETELNSIIIDIKDFTGTISFNVKSEELIGVNGNGCRVADMKDFIADLHNEGIYVIGRVTVFQDPFYTTERPDLAVKRESDGAVWKDYKGISFIEVGAKEYWDYIIDLAKESHQIGFDEINFDYIRFPSDGNMRDIYYPFSQDLINKDPEFGKAIALEEFFTYLKKEIDKYNLEQDFPIITSADLFGMVTTNTNDLNIGQVLERALPYFDYIAPMVYPSHYPPHFNGWTDPNKYPYELIHYVMSSAVDRVEAFKTATTTDGAVREHVSVEQLRPWLQDFDYGGNYDIAEVSGQIQATYDAGLDSWMLWAPSNRYTRGALKGAGE